jgi:hypothetical protein
VSLLLLAALLLQASLRMLTTLLLLASLLAYLKLEHIRLSDYHNQTGELKKENYWPAISIITPVFLSVFQL